MWLLLIPPVALLLAWLVAVLRRRPARTREAMVTIEGYRRMMAALAPPGGTGAARVPSGVEVPAGSVGAVVPCAREVAETAAGAPHSDGGPATVGESRAT